jgi:hypothetical protein
MSKQIDPKLAENSTASSAAPLYRFTGHETFAFRYSWLPKAFFELSRDPQLFVDEPNAMVRLGVGRNMVKSIRFWVQAAGMAATTKSGIEPTSFGKSILDEKSGFDPYLEDIRTLWLIHWKIASNATEPLFAWEFLFNRWQHPEISRTEVVSAFLQEASRMNRKLSNVTVEQHFDTFLHTYVPTRSSKGDVREDNLDSPLVELDLIRRSGEKRLEDSGRTESAYIFNRDAKPSVTPELFCYCVQDYWQKRSPNEETLSFRDIAVNLGSVGQIFKLPETDIRHRLESLDTDSKGALSFRESSAISHVTKNPVRRDNPLATVYETELIYA